MSTATENLLSELEAAAFLGVSLRTMQRIREEGLIAFTRLGLGKRAPVYFSHEDIAEYVASQRVPAMTAKAPAKQPARRKAS